MLYLGKWRAGEAQLRGEGQGSLLKIEGGKIGAYKTRGLIKGSDGLLDVYGI